MITVLQSALEISNSKEELLFKDDNPQLPYVCHFCDGEQVIGNRIPWHWHEMVEITYVTHGPLTFRTASGEVEIDKGDALFANANVLHTSRLSRSTRYYSHLFNTHMLSGGYDSLMEQTYFAPLLRCRDLELYKITPDSPERVRMIDHLNRTMEAMRDEPFGYEFQIREHLTKFWLGLYRETQHIWMNTLARSGQDSERMKLMLQFIYDHFPEQISLADIASAAGISTRECTRCFNRAMSRTPVRYLTEYRVQRAAQKLLQTDRTVSLVAEECGFASDRYFGKVFREMTGRTPREYRAGGRA